MNSLRLFLLYEYFGSKGNLASTLKLLKAFTCYKHLGLFEIKGPPRKCCVLNQSFFFSLKDVVMSNFDWDLDSHFTG